MKVGDGLNVSSVLGRQKMIGRLVDVTGVGKLKRMPS